MSVYIEPLDQVVKTSMFSLDADAFDLVNYTSDADAASAGAHPPNACLDADTPKGVLGGSVAALSLASAPVNDWAVKQAGHAAFGTSGRIVGLFGANSEGNAFENAPAAASGKIAVYMAGGLFHVYAFETNTSVRAGSGPYTWASILGNYTVGAALYCSPQGLLTTVAPSSYSSNPFAAGADNVVGYVTKAPTSTDLELGMVLMVKNA